MDWEERLKLFDSLIDAVPGLERKGKTMPYTSVNGYMFALLNKAGEIGIRFSKEQQKLFFEKYDTKEYRSYGAVMHGYILIPESLLRENKKEVVRLLQESFTYFQGQPKK